MGNVMSRKETQLCALVLLQVSRNEKDVPVFRLVFVPVPVREIRFLVAG